MSDIDNDIYSRIKGKLANHECDVPKSCWEAVERSINRQRRLIRHKRIARWSTAAAAAAIIGILVFIGNDKTSLPENGNIAEYLDSDSSKRNNVSSNFVNFETVLAKTENDKGSDNVTVSSTGVYVLKQKNESATAVESFAGNNAAIAETYSAETVENMPVKDNKSDTPANHEDDYNIGISDKDSVGLNDMLKLYKDSKPDRKIAKYDNGNFSDPVSDNGISISLVAANALNANIRRERDLSQNNMPLHEELELYSSQEQLKFNHKMPFSAGITVEKRWKNNWGLESGIMYTLLRSTYSTESNTQQGEQELHYIGIPVNVTYRFAQVKMFGFYAAAGPKIDFNVSGKRTESIQNDLAKSNASENIRDKKPQLSVQLRLGVACTLVKHLELYVEPSLAYYIDNKGDIPDLWKDKPLNFVLQFGLRTGF